MAALAIAVGCASPPPVVTNVVRDSDVRGCSPDKLDRIAGLDVAIVIDRSLSTRRPSGMDVDGNGIATSFHRNSTFDRGDSRLAAMVDSVRLLLRNARGHDVRFSIVTFSGPGIDRLAEDTPLVGSGSDSKLYARLGQSTPQMERALTKVLDGGSQGTSIFYAGMNLGAHSLTSIRDSTRRRIVLFIADSPRTTGIPPTGANLRGDLIFRDPRMKNAAILARERKIIFHTFGFSRNAEDWRHDPLGQIAGATGGNFHAVEDPAEFYCHLAHSVTSPSSGSDWETLFARAKRDRAAKEK